MKKYIANIVIPVLMLCGITACSDWTEAEPTYKPNHALAPKSPEYYAKLRDWKLNDDHPRTFGWYGNWTGRGASGEHRLMGLPDSVDFVSMWGNWWGLSEDQMEDKRQAYEIKGLRVKICFIIGNIGDQLTPKSALNAQKAEDGTTYYEYNGKRYNSTEEVQAAVWGWYSNNLSEKSREDYYYDETEDKIVRVLGEKGVNDATFDQDYIGQERIDNAIRKYAQALTDTIIKYDFHGYDYDLERNYGSPGNIANHSKRITTFLKEMSKTCGPKSGTNRLLCVDGQPDILEPECAELLDFFILQAYYATGPGSLENGSPRINSVVRNFEGVMSKEEILKKIIVTEDFEQKPEMGGKYEKFTTRDGRVLPPIWGMADYFTEDGHQIGGFGVYHMEYDYKNTYATIQDAHKSYQEANKDKPDKQMDLSPAKLTGATCYGYLNGGINLLHNPKNPAAKQQSNN